MQTNDNSCYSPTHAFCSNRSPTKGYTPHMTSWGAVCNTPIRERVGVSSIWKSQWKYTLKNIATAFMYMQHHVTQEQVVLSLYTVCGISMDRKTYSASDRFFPHANCIHTMTLLFNLWFPQKHIDWEPNTWTDSHLKREQNCQCSHSAPYV